MRLTALTLLALVACTPQNPCDLDGDGNDSAAADRTIAVQSIGLLEGDVRFPEAMDFDGDGVITAGDYGDWMVACLEE